MSDPKVIYGRPFNADLDLRERNGRALDRTSQNASGRQTAGTNGLSILGVPPYKRRENHSEEDVSG
jgi:hypothetical protein